MSKYQFNKTIETKLQGFDKYMKSKKYAVDTIRQNRNYVGLFLKWLEQESLIASEVEYRSITDFIFQLKKENSINQSKRIVLAVRHYYNSIDLDINPAAGIHLRGSRRSILNDIVPYDQLLDLYQSYQALDDRTKRNKVILGLLIYQALTTKELHQLEPKNIKLADNKIYVPGGHQRNKRILNLEAEQLLLLQEYLTEIRLRMLENVRSYRPGRKPEQINPMIYDKLFFSENGSVYIKTSLQHLFKAVKKINRKITSGKIIRNTVIVEWLKTKDVRTVQYMAGHRYVSSTERYDVGNLKELKEQMKKYHPLK